MHYFGWFLLFIMTMLIIKLYVLIIAIFSRLENSIFFIFLLLDINLFTKYSKTYVNLFSILSNSQGVPSIRLPNGSSWALHVSVWTGWLPSLQLRFLALFCIVSIYLILFSASLVHTIILMICKLWKVSQNGDGKMNP